MWEGLKYFWVEFVPTVALLVSSAALVYAALQFRANRLSHRETTAKATFRDFIRFACEHTVLAEGNYQQLIAAGKRDEYEWFIGYMLWAAEEILDYAELKKDQTWKDNMQWHADKHCGFFKTNKEFREKELPIYKPSVRELVQRAIKSCPK